MLWSLSQTCVHTLAGKQICSVHQNCHCRSAFQRATFVFSNSIQKRKSSNKTSGKRLVQKQKLLLMDKTSMMSSSSINNVYNFSATQSATDIQRFSRSHTLPQPLSWTIQCVYQITDVWGHDRFQR